MPDSGDPPLFGDFGREIGRVTGRSKGPTLIAVAGMHGNEHGGLHAARRVLARLAEVVGDVRGEFVALAGNLGAIRSHTRYLARDLNRRWSDPEVDAVLRGETRDPEDDQQRELHAAIAEVIAKARGEVYLVDMHTTSAPGVPFVIFGDTMRQRRFVLELPIPLLLGLEEQIDGTLAEYWTRRGCVTFAIEGGQHDDPSSVDSLAAVLWVALESSGVLGRNAVPEIGAARELLEARRGSLPRVMEVLSRRAITAGDRFVMEPGFANLDHARGGQLLARDRNGEVRAPHDGMVILPLYQPQGSDGFFWGRAVSALRLRASELLRALSFERALPYLPGVRRDPSQAHRFIVDARVARMYPPEVFHLFGYRRIREGDGHITVARQPD